MGEEENCWHIRVLVSTPRLACTAPPFPVPPVDRPAHCVRYASCGWGGTGYVMPRAAWMHGLQPVGAAAPLHGCRPMHPQAQPVVCHSLVLIILILCTQAEAMVSRSRFYYQPGTVLLGCYRASRIVPSKGAM